MKQTSTSPTLANDDEPIVTQGDFDRARLRVGIMLDVSVIAWFKAKAGRKLNAQASVQSPAHPAHAATHAQS